MKDCTTCKYNIEHNCSKRLGRVIPCMGCPQFADGCKCLQYCNDKHHGEDCPYYEQYEEEE